MRSVQPIIFTAFMTTLVLTSAIALAAKVDVNVDKRIVSPNSTLVISGTITDDNGTSGNFDYRIAVIGPGKRDGGERIIICDSGKQNTNGTSSISFNCQIPTLEGLQELGIENSAERAVIPLKGGVAVFDPATNKTEKEHAKALIVNTGKFQTRYENAIERLDGFIARAQELFLRCDNITARAEEAGAEKVIERCNKFQSKLQEQINKAAQAKERINNALSNLNNLTSFNFDNLKDSFVNFKDGARDFKIEVKDVKDFVEKARADLEKKVAKEIAEKTKERTKDLRENIVKEKERIKEKLNEIKEKVKERREGKSGSGEKISESSGSSESSGPSESAGSGKSGLGESSGSSETSESSKKSGSNSSGSSGSGGG